MLDVFIRKNKRAKRKQGAFVIIKKANSITKLFAWTITLEYLTLNLLHYYLVSQGLITNGTGFESRGEHRIWDAGTSS